MHRLLEAMPMLLSSMALVLLLAACDRIQEGGRGKQPPNENTLRLDVASPIGSFHPFESVYQSGTNAIFPLLYDYLFVPNERGELEPDLAMDWRYDPSTHKWIIRLRNDAFFHDKRRITAKDVQYSLMGHIAQRGLTQLSNVVDRVSVLSDSTISIDLKQDVPELLQQIWSFEIVPAPAGSSAQTTNHTVGSGPFRFKHKDGDHRLVLEASRDYFKGRPSIDRIVLEYFADTERSWARLLSGKTDVVRGLYPKDYEMIRQYQDKFYFDIRPSSFCSLLLYNSKHPLFSSVNVRQALSQGIDRAYLVEKILRGAGVVAIGTMGLDSPYCRPDLQPVPFDPQNAAELLRQEGWGYDNIRRSLVKNGVPFEFKLLIFEGDQISMKVGEYIRLCLNELGIRVHLLPVSVDSLCRSYVEGNDFEAVLTEVSLSQKHPEVIQILWARDSIPGSGPLFFQNTEVSSLVAQAIKETDPAVRKDLYQRIEGLVAALQPATFLFHKSTMDAMSRRFTLPCSFSLQYAGLYRLRYASIVSR